MLNYFDPLDLNPIAHSVPRTFVGTKWDLPIIMLLHAKTILFFYILCLEETKIHVLHWNLLVYNLLTIKTTTLCTEGDRLHAHNHISITGS